MSRSCAIALTGLSPTEQVLLEGALFPLTGSPIPGAYLERDLAQAHLVIAGADDVAAVSALKARALPGQVLLLGNSDMGTGWPVVARPLRLHAVTAAARRVLASPHTVEEDRHAGEPSGFEATRPAGFSELGDLPDFESTRPNGTGVEPRQSVPARHEEKAEFQAPRSGDDSVPSVLPSDWEAEVAVWEDLRTSRAAGVDAHAGAAASPGADLPGGPAPLEDGRRILVVGLPGTAAKGLMKTLRAEGFETDLADGRELAFTLLAQRHYGFVFVIEVSLGPAAIPLCQSIHAAQAAVHLVVVASHNKWLPRLRARLAGCEAWMPIPLKQAALVQFLKQHAPPGSAPP
jgi:CheY-like chemotaxis protein